jgi:hypothetical protein
MKARFRLAALCAAFAVTVLPRAAFAEEAAPAFTFERFLVAPLHIHLLVSTTEAALCTTLSDSDVERIIGKVNGVWSQAGIAFFVEKVTREEPAPLDANPEMRRFDQHGVVSRMPRESRGGECYHLYYIKDFDVNGVCFPSAIFVKDTASLRPVEGGIDEPIPRVTSHELGHALGLPHRQERTNLMASGTTGTSLNATEIECAREIAAKRGWFVSGPELLAKADALHTAGEAAAARSRYQTLARLPLEPEVAQRLRERTGK